MTGVGEYLQATARRRWEWGTEDCCTFIAGWVIERGNADPMGFIRGCYDSETSALRRIWQGGGLIQLWTRGMIDAQVPEADEAQLGDVGIIETATASGEGQACAIFTGSLWASRGIVGLEVGPGSPLIVWRP